MGKGKGILDLMFICLVVLRILLELSKIRLRLEKIRYLFEKAITRKNANTNDTKEQ
jgi:hypothetical protein